jgi:arsenic resistance protein ArsH
MLPSSYYDRIVDVAEELVRFPVLTRGHTDQLVGRYSERKDRNEPVVTPAELARIPGV